MLLWRDEMTKSETTQYSTDVSILRLLSEQQYKRKTGPLVELAKNSLDAGAPVINFFLDRGQDSGSMTIRVADNGDGMDIDGINKFYKIAGSDKKKVGVNSKGRPMIGKYGIGNLGLYALGANHILETVEAGVLRTVKVDFNHLETLGNKWQAEQFDIQQKADRRRSSGTSILVSDIRGKYRPQFGQLANQLVDALGRELRGQLSFADIRVNGIQVVSYLDKLLKGTDPTEVSFGVRDPDTRKTYQVNGRIWLLDNTLDSHESGVFPIINNTNPVLDGHLYGSMPAGWSKLRDRVYGELQVDFLESKLDLTRDGFIDIRDDALLVAYHAALNEKLRELLNVHIQQVKANTSKDEQQFLENLVALSGQLFRGHSGTERRVDTVTKDPKKKPQDPGVLTRSFDDDEEESPSPSDKSKGCPSPGKSGSSGPSVPTGPITKGNLEIRLGGRTLSMRFVDNPEAPLIAIEGSTNPEILLNRGHALYVEAQTRGLSAVRDTVEPLLITTLSAYRLDLDGETSYQAVADMVEAKLKKLGKRRSREAQITE